MTAEAALTELVLRPLGMTRSFFFARDAITHRVSAGHFVYDDGPRVARPWFIPRNAHAISVASSPWYANASRHARDVRHHSAVALAAYQWVPLFPNLGGVSHRRVLPLPQRAARLATFCDGYGGMRPAEAIDALGQELPFHAELIQRLADGGDPGSMKLAGWNVPERLRRESESLRRERASLVRD